MKMNRILSLLSALMLLLTVTLVNVSCSSDDTDTTTEYSVKRAELFTRLKEIAKANPDGYTVDATTLQPITTGYAVSVAATQSCFNDEGLYKVIDYVLSHSEIKAYGGWLDSLNGDYYYDATMVIDDRDEAITYGRNNGQKAIFDLNTMTVIPISY